MPEALPSLSPKLPVSLPPQQPSARLCTASHHGILSLLQMLSMERWLPKQLFQVLPLSNALALPVFLASAALGFLQRDNFCVLFGFPNYSVGSVDVLTAILSTQKRKQLRWEGKMDWNMESDLL